LGELVRSDILRLGDVASITRLILRMLECMRHVLFGNFVCINVIGDTYLSDACGLL
jgi:hypothetical protein